MPSINSNNQRNKDGFIAELEMKRMIRAIYFSLASFFLTSAVQAFPNEYVKIIATAAKDTVRAGKETKLLFHIQPQEGFHVNIEPPISLQLMEGKKFALLTKKFVPDSTVKTVTTKDGYKIFDPGQPVAFAVKVEKNTKPGRYPLKTKLTYYYCSDAEGWCSFTSEEFVINLVVVK
jgi:hypothetical protein